MTDKSNITPSERRRLMAVLARGIATDLEAAETPRPFAAFPTSAGPSPCGPLPDGSPDKDRLRAQSINVLSELLSAASLLALGLRPDSGDDGVSQLLRGLYLVAGSPVLKHVAECPGHPDTHNHQEEQEPGR